MRVPSKTSTQGPPPSSETLEHSIAAESQSRKVILIFKAEWCPRCSSLARDLSQFSNESPDYKIITIDYDKNPQLAEKYNVESMPFVAVIDRNKVQGHHDGYGKLISLLAWFEGFDIVPKPVPPGSKSRIQVVLPKNKPALKEFGPTASLQQFQALAPYARESTFAQASFIRFYNRYAASDGNPKTLSEADIQNAKAQLLEELELAYAYLKKANEGLTATQFLNIDQIQARDDWEALPTRVKMALPHARNLLSASWKTPELYFEHIERTQLPLAYAITFLKAAEKIESHPDKDRRNDLEVSIFLKQLVKSGRKDKVFLLQKIRQFHLSGQLPSVNEALSRHYEGKRRFRRYLQASSSPFAAIEFALEEVFRGQRRHEAQLYLHAAAFEDILRSQVSAEPGVSEKIEKQTIEDLRRLPAPVIEAMAKEGYRIEMVRNLKAAVGTAAFGITFPEPKGIFVEVKGKPRALRRGILFHEIGHALDFSNEHFNSSSIRFRDARSQDYWTLWDYPPQKRGTHGDYSENMYQETHGQSFVRQFVLDGLYRQSHTNLSHYWELTLPLLEEWQ